MGGTTDKGRGPASRQTQDKVSDALCAAAQWAQRAEVASAGPCVPGVQAWGSLWR